MGSLPAHRRHSMATRRRLGVLFGMLLASVALHGMVKGAEEETLDEVLEGRRGGIGYMTTWGTFHLGVSLNRAGNTEDKDRLGEVELPNRGARKQASDAELTAGQLAESTQNMEDNELAESDRAESDLSR